MEIPQQLLDELIEEAKEDEVGLWMVLRYVRDLVPDVAEEPSLLQAATLKCVAHLLASGEVVAGQYMSDGTYRFEVWDMAPKKIIAYIEDEWNKLGRDPNIAEIVVLIGSTPRGTS